MDNKLLLPDAAQLKPHNDKTPFAYKLLFSDGSCYVGSASGMYRLRRYKSIAQGTYPSVVKNPLLITALQTLLCHVELTWCASLEQAREVEKAWWLTANTAKVELLNCREWGHAGKWVKQDATTHLRRISALSRNGKLANANDVKLPDGRSRKVIKSIIVRAINLGKPLTSVKGLSNDLFNELTAEVLNNAA